MYVLSFVTIDPAHLTTISQMRLPNHMNTTGNKNPHNYYRPHGEGVHFGELLATYCIWIQYLGSPNDSSQVS